LRLVGQSFRIVRREPSLMVVALLTGLVELALFGLAALAVWGTGHQVATDTGPQFRPSPGGIAAAVLAGLLATLVGVLGQATLVTRIVNLLRGQPMGNGRAFAMAMTRAPSLLGFAVISWVVMTLINAIERRFGILGRLAGVALSVAWRLASFFAIPIIVFEQAGPLSAVKRSLHLCRSRWGEEIVGVSAFSILGFLGFLAIFVVATLLGMLFVPLGVGFGLLGLVAMLLVLSVAQSAFTSALYLFAESGQVPLGFSAADLNAAFRPRRAGLLR
jgi:hypothetical protein